MMATDHKQPKTNKMIKSKDRRKYEIMAAVYTIKMSRSYEGGISDTSYKEYFSKHFSNNKTRSRNENQNKSTSHHFILKNN